MKASFKIGEISGIPVRLHITLLIIVGFLAWSFGSDLPTFAEALGIGSVGVSSGFQSYLIGMILAVGLFVSVLLHEVAHSLIARGMGVRIEEISLWIFGGVSNMEEIPRDPNSEIKISVVGPLTSFGIGIACYLIGIIFSTIAILSLIFIILGFINVILGIFNLIPAFPMDGGRILRASLAKRKSYIEATNTAATVGKAIAILIATVGIFIFTNFFLIIIALFIYMGASQEAESTIVSEVLRKIKVEKIMSREVKTVPPDMSVREFLNYAWTVQHTGFPVVENGEILGIVTLEDVREIDQAEADEVTVKEVMEKEVVHFSPEDVADDVWQKMMKMDVGRFPIVSEGELVGIVTRSDVMRSFRNLRQVKSYEGSEI